MRFFNNKRGFSLVELLGVVSIIGILATVVMFNMQAAKEKARDAQRISDLQQLQVALRLYKDVNGIYPPTQENLDAVDEYFGGTRDSSISYSPAHINCSGQNILYVSLERSESSNWTAVCNGTEPGTNTYVGILR